MSAAGSPNSEANNHYKQLRRSDVTPIIAALALDR